MKKTLLALATTAVVATAAWHRRQLMRVAAAAVSDLEFLAA